MIDYQRQRVYNAEKAFVKWRGGVMAQRIEEVADIQKWVDQLMERPEFRRRWALRKIVVRDGRRRRRAGGWYGNITIPKWCRNVQHFLHEIAHALRMGDKGYAHDHYFCRDYIQLVQIATSRHEAMLFAGYLRGHDCDCEPENRGTRLVIKHEDKVLAII